VCILPHERRLNRSSLLVPSWTALSSSLNLAPVANGGAFSQPRHAVPRHRLPPRDSYIAGCGRKRCHCCVMTSPVADNAQMSPRSYLNEYQLQFLKLLVDRRCRFLIIGGQARSIHEGTVTRDLDVWVDLSSANRPTLDLTLLAWATEHRIHSSADFSQTPLPLRPCVQIISGVQRIFHRRGR
jgi:hypothetical protein